MRMVRCVHLMHACKYSVTMAVFHFSWLRLRRGSMPVASYLEILIEPLTLYLLLFLTYPNGWGGVQSSTAVWSLWLVFTSIDMMMLCLLQVQHQPARASMAASFQVLTSRVYIDVARRKSLRNSWLVGSVM
jgi:hypothetical protein